MCVRSSDCGILVVASAIPRRAHVLLQFCFMFL